LHPCNKDEDEDFLFIGSSPSNSATVFSTVAHSMYYDQEENVKRLPQKVSLYTNPQPSDLPALMPGALNCSATCNNLPPLKKRHGSPWWGLSYLDKTLLL
jgi:hypothetical protein